MSKSKALIAAELRISELELDSKEQIAALELRLAACMQANDALGTRLVIAKTVYRNQRAHIAELESKLATRGCIDNTLPDDGLSPDEPLPSEIEYKKRETREYAALNCGIGYIKTAPKPVVTYFTKRDGTTWEKTRVGNRASMREVTHA